MYIYYIWMHMNTLSLSLQNFNNVHICVWIFLGSIACIWPCIEIFQTCRHIWVGCDYFENNSVVWNWSIRNHNKTLQDTNSMDRFICIAYRQRCWKFALFRVFCRHKTLYCTVLAAPGTCRASWFSWNSAALPSIVMCRKILTKQFGVATRDQ